MLPFIRHRWPRAVFPMTILVIVVLAIGLLLLISPRAAAAQDLTRHSAMLILRGEDTLAFERVARTATHVRAEVLGPGQPRVAVVHELGADHLIRRTVFEVFAPNAADGATAIQTGSVDFLGDTAVMEFVAGGQTRTIRVATPPGTLPIINNDLVVVEQAVRRARALGVDTLSVPLFALSAAQVIDGRIEFIAADTVRFTIMQNVTIVAVDAQSFVTGGSVPSVGLQIVVIEGAPALAMRAGRPNYAPPANAPYTAEEVIVPTRAGHTLAGTLTLPSREAGTRGRLPAVVTITGSGHQDRDEFVPIAGGYRLFRQVADTLGRRGIAVLRMDDRGIGGSGGDPLGTSADFADDIRAAVAYLRTRPEIDPARIALVGHSEGGMIAPMVAADDRRIAAVVLLAGTAYTGRQIIDYQIANSVRGSNIPEAQQDSAIAAHAAQFDSTTGRSAWMQYFMAYDPQPTARRVRQPTLILQGATDQQVRKEEAELLDRAMRAAGNRRVTLRIFPDQNHFFIHDPNGHPAGYTALKSANVEPVVLGTLADWLVETLRRN